MKKLNTIIAVLILISLILCMITFTKAYQEQCPVEDYEDLIAMENDFICGDFGVLYFKMFFIVMGHALLGGAVLICGSEEEKK